MKVSYFKMFVRLAHDVDLDPFTVSYCLKRLRSEGITFLTVTLPKLSKAVLASLEKGYFDRSTLTCFAWKGKSLRYFTKFLNKIFDRKTGLVLDDPDALAIYLLRQLCEYVYKLALKHTPRQSRDALKKFLGTEEELGQDYCKPLIERLRKDFHNHFKDIVKGRIEDVFTSTPPRPGTGTFSGPCDQYPWYYRRYVDDGFPPRHAAHAGYFRATPRNPRPRLNVTDNGYSEVLFVPKDSRGPRTIVREPFSRLKSQMSFFDYMTASLEKATRGRIQFKDQQRNRSVAEQSSIDRKFATVDLESASDRVRFDVLLRLFRDVPIINWFLLNARTPFAMTPNGEIVKLRKVAGMGSGLTFPLMSLLIYLVAVRATADYLRISWEDSSQMCGTYGDDLFLPIHAYELFCQYAESISLRINKEKSFVKSNFRESCGGDYFNGQDVTPVRLKLTHADPIIADQHIVIVGGFSCLQLERHCRELVKSGLVGLADYYYSILEKSYGKLPWVSGESPCLGRYRVVENDVLSSLATDDCGNFKLVRAIVPTPVVEEELSRDHYHLYGQSLRRFGGRASWDDYLVHRPGSNVNGVVIPRKIQLVRKRVSGLVLAG